MTAAAKAAVIVTKPNGSRIVFTITPTEREAELVAAQLAAVGLLGAKVEPARRGDVAGSARR